MNPFYQEWAGLSFQPFLSLYLGSSAITDHLPLVSGREQGTSHLDLSHRTQTDCLLDLSLASFWVSVPLMTFLSLGPGRSLGLSFQTFLSLLQSSSPIADHWSPMEPVMSESTQSDVNLYHKVPDRLDQALLCHRK